MDSFFARNRLSAYLDGKLPEPEASEVAAAIERDPELNAEYEHLRRSVNLLRTEGPVKAPAGFHARVMEQVRDEPHPGGVVIQLQRFFRRIPTEAMALAAAAAVVMMVVQARSDQANLGTGEAGGPTGATFANESTGPDFNLNTGLNPASVATASNSENGNTSQNGSPSSGSSDLSMYTADEVLHLSLVTKDANLLRSLYNLVTSTGTDAKMLEPSDSEGSAVQLQTAPFTDNDNFKRAFLTIPPDKYLDFRNALVEMGAEKSDSGPDIVQQCPTPNDSQAVFVLDVFYLAPL